MYERQVRLMWLRFARERHMQGKIITQLRQNWLRLSGRRFLWRHVLFPLVALALLVLGLLWPRLQLEVLLLGVLLVASWPWVWSHLQQKVLPTTLSGKLAALQVTQEQQQVEIDQLAVCLLRECLQGSELHYLRQLAASEAFLLGKHEVTERLLVDFRRLCALGLVDRVAGRGFRTFLEAMQGQGDGIDVKAHFCITDRGKKYLALLQRELAAWLADS
jgi:hypothetical protein